MSAEARPDRRDLRDRTRSVNPADWARKPQLPIAIRTDQTVMKKVVFTSRARCLRRLPNTLGLQRRMQSSKNAILEVGRAGWAKGQGSRPNAQGLGYSQYTEAIERACFKRGACVTIVNPAYAPQIGNKCHRRRLHASMHVAACTIAGRSRGWNQSGS